MDRNDSMSDVKGVLVIDDSRVSRLMVNAILKQHFPDAHLYEAGNAEETLALEINEELSHIICDFNMPGMDGIELSTELQKRHPNTVITLLTANIQASIRNKAEDQGLFFAKKPVTEERILSILKKTKK